jgi:hypothetical protein
MRVRWRDMVTCTCTVVDKTTVKRIGSERPAIAPASPL